MAPVGTNSSDGEGSDTDSSVGSGYPAYVTLKQFADLPHIGVTYQTALRWVEQQKVRATRVGGRWRIYRTELERIEREGVR